LRYGFFPGTGLAESTEAFVVWRIAGGVAIGLASSLSPVYIAEIAPAHLRGKRVSVNQLTIVIGLVLAQGINWLIARPLPARVTPSQILHSWDGQLGCRWMFGVTAIPATVFLVAMLPPGESKVVGDEKETGRGVAHPGARWGKLVRRSGLAGNRPDADRGR
jgi:SP family xylose:H+ symportor-like MFS transporter